MSLVNYWVKVTHFCGIKSDVSQVSCRFLEDEMSVIMDLGVLFLVACKLETPSIVSSLLDIQTHPCKPVYKMASHLPLVLFDSSYDNLHFRYDRPVINSLCDTLETRQQQLEIKATLNRSALDRMESLDVFKGEGLQRIPKLCDYDGAVKMLGKGTPYRPLLERTKCMSYEDRLKNLSSNKRKAANQRHGWNL